ncbi:MAG: hypothetical protein IKA11_04815 [Clostridia bacterium]|nr:hypothetical protein [Clostridia bacterium]
MALTKKQMELDKIKWEISESMGVDACGSFEFCPLCNKDLENPCDKAYKKFHAKDKVKKVKKTATKKSAKKEVAATKVK